MTKYILTTFSIFTFLLSNSLSGLSQNSKLEKGYIITSEGDTINGYINRKTPKLNEIQCEFTSEKGSKSKFYSPNEIKGYGIENYKTFEKIQIYGITVFMESLVRGTLSLYRYDRKYYAFKDGQLKLLEIKIQKILNNNTTINQEFPVYREALKSLTNDCENVQARISTVRLREKSLTKFVNSYNICNSGKSVVNKSNLPWVLPVVGLKAMFRRSSLNFISDDNSGQDFRYITDADFDASNQIVPSLSFEFLFPRFNDRFSLQLEFSAVKHKHNGESIIPRSTFISTTLSPFINQHFIEIKSVFIPISVKYVLIKRQVSPYLLVGINPTINYSKTSSRIQENSVTGEPMPRRIDFGNQLQPRFKKIEFGLFLGVGLQKHFGERLAYFLESRFEFTDGFLENSLSPTTDLKARRQNLYILSGLTFKLIKS